MLPALHRLSLNAMDAVGPEDTALHDFVLAVMYGTCNTFLLLLREPKMQ